MARRPSQVTSGTDLLAEIERLRRLVRTEDGVTAVVHELEVQREELWTQQMQLRQSQHDLEASRDRYADLFDFAPIAYVLLDDKGIVTDINLTGSQLLGSERARLVDFPFLSFVDVSDRRRFLDYLGRCRRAEQPVEIELTLVSRDHRAIPVHLTTKRLPAAAKSRECFQMAVADQTERRRAAEERRRIEQREQAARAANEAKDRFIAVLSHELRTPLTPILLTLASLERTGSIPDALGPAIKMVRRNVELEARLIDDLLDVTRITQGKLRLVIETVDVHAVVEDVVGLCAEEVRTGGLRLELDLAAEASRVRGDATRLRQVVWNLLRNAVRHTPATGKVTVQTRNERAGGMTLTVRDTGIGISPELLQRLFLPFEQGPELDVHGAGLGLGLSISKGLVDAHRGRIWAESAGEGRGATFSVELDTTAAPVDVVDPRAPKPSTRRVSSPKRILLVEDNPDNAEAIAGLLRACGYEVECAGSVADALGKAEQGFDVLVSDIGLPDGTGRDVVRQLCARRRTPAIALTGYGTDNDIRSNTEAGFARHLTKPVDADELLAAIAELVDAGAPGRVARSRRRA